MNNIDQALDYPLLFKPIPKIRVWGGKALPLKRGMNSDNPIGESWEICDHGGDVSIITNGSLRGKNLHEIFSAFPEEIAGKNAGMRFPDRFPLLLKLLDSRERLSVQVHPNDEYAAKSNSGDSGKTEAWYILEADPGAYIYRGLKDNLSKEDLRQALAEGDLEKHLHRIEVSPGEVFFIPSGMIHALGEGVRLAEIQQNSDTTYRLFDWNRVGLDGKPRQLHLEDGLAVSQLNNEGPQRCIPEEISQEGCTRERFVSCDKFAMERLRGFLKRVPLSTQDSSFQILTVIEGILTVETKSGNETLSKWETCLVPACCGEYCLRGEAATEALLFYIP